MACAAYLHYFSNLELVLFSYPTNTGFFLGKVRPRYDSLFFGGNNEFLCVGIDGTAASFRYCYVFEHSTVLFFDLDALAVY